MKNIMWEEMSAREIYEKVFEGLKIILTEKITEYGPSNIYNIDETCLFVKIIPLKSLITTVRKGFKNFKDRVTIFLCAISVKLTN